MNYETSITIMGVLLVGSLLLLVNEALLRLIQGMVDEEIQEENLRFASYRLKEEN